MIFGKNEEGGESHGATQARRVLYPLATIYEIIIPFLQALGEARMHYGVYRALRFGITYL